MSDHTIPDEGMNLTCPRCKTDFHVDKPRKKATSAYATNTCPSCGYSTFCEEVFDECPHCGMDVQTASEQKRKQEAQRREMELRNTASASTVLPPISPVLPKSGLKYTGADEPEQVRIKFNLATFADGFNPVAAIGWGVVAVAFALLLAGGSGLLDYLGTDLQAKLSENSLEPVSAWKVFCGYGFMPWVELSLGIVLLVVGFIFLQRHSKGLWVMVKAVQAVLILVPIYQIGRFVVWIVNSTSPPWWGYLVEILSTLLVAALLMVPLWIVLQYLESDRFAREYKDQQATLP